MKNVPKLRNYNVQFVMDLLVVKAVNFKIAVTLKLFLNYSFVKNAVKKKIHIIPT